MKGYHQISMAPKSKDKTAFTCHLGLFQYKRMSFGLTNAPATFQRLMNKLFSGVGWNFVFVYLDDILIVSKSFEEHLQHVEKVLRQLEEVGLKLRPKKCCFAQTRIEYLGHTLSPQGVQPNDGKVKAVKDFPRPMSCTEVKQFLGIVNICRRHVPNLAKDKSTGSTVQFMWNDDCESAFKEIKEKLVSAPLLHPPDLTKQFYLCTDTSEKGFGALLDRKGRAQELVSYCLCQQTDESCRSQVRPQKLEVAALVYAVEHFEVYLLGNEFTVYTDHQALVSAFISHMESQTRGLLARWYLRISRFLPKMRIEYKPGAANVVADSLSRAPLTETENRRVLHMTEEVPCLQLVQEEQKKDKELSELMNYLKDKLLPSEEHAAKQILAICIS